MSVESESHPLGLFMAEQARNREILEESQSYSPEFSEPIETLLEKASIMPRGEPLSFGATPLDKLATQEQQDTLLVHLLHETYSVPEGISMELALYVHDTFTQRFKDRAFANNENYLSSLFTKISYEENEAVQELISRAETGYASPAELLLVQQLLGIRSVELACLTHPYGERIKPLLNDMRAVVGRSVEEMGGELHVEPETHYRAKEVILKDVPEEDQTKIYTLSNAERLAIADQYGGVSGILMTRKRELGIMPNGSIIKERSSFILRLDECGLVSEEALEAMKKVPKGREWQDDIVKTACLDEIADLLLEMDEYALAIPSASTIYAHNPLIAKLVQERFGNGKNPVYDLVHAVTPETADGQMPKGRVSYEINGMYFLGYEGDEALNSPDEE